jgi:rfaE bifunctional protein nucleotidyltransferase chain/domain
MKNIVFVYGVYDLFHLGHLKLLERAKSYGDYLVVGIVEDKAVKKLKGKNRPIIPTYQRAQLVYNLKCVDKVILQKEFNPIQTIENLLFEDGIKVNTLVLGEDQNHLSHNNLKYLMRRYNMIVERLPRTKGISTSDIIEKIRSEK